MYGTVRRLVCNVAVISVLGMMTTKLMLPESEYEDMVRRMRSVVIKKE